MGMDPSLEFDHGVSEGQLFAIESRKIERAPRMCESGMANSFIESPGGHER
jgi:hypothetical protein